MGCTELQSVRLSRCAVKMDIDAIPSEEAKITLKLNAKSDGRQISETELRLHFDFKLTGSQDAEPQKPVEITLRLVAVYSLPRGLQPSEAEMKAFAATNGLLNVWPYFREFTQSISARAGLPPLTVPLFRIQQKLGPTQAAQLLRSAVPTPPTAASKRESLHKRRDQSVK